jgi:hypothetical protein
MFNKKNKENNGDGDGVEQTIKLGKSDVAIILRGTGRSETICTLKGKHTLTPQEEIIMGLGALLQQGKFVDSIREYFMINMQNMLSSNMANDIAEDK